MVRFDVGGKNTILHKLKLGEVDKTIPAIGIIMSERHAHRGQLQLHW